MKSKTPLRVAADLMAITTTVVLLHFFGRLIHHEITLLDTFIDGIVILLIWMGNLALLGSYEGVASITAVEELRRITHATVLSFLITSTIAYMTKSAPARTLAVLIPILGLVLIAVGRTGIRRWDKRRKLRGLALRNVLILGTQNYAQDLEHELDEAKEIGLRIVHQVDLPIFTAEDLELWFQNLTDAIMIHNIDSVIIQDTSQVHPDLVSRISWALSKKHLTVYVAPTFINLLGPRLEMHPHPRLALIALHEPTLTISERVLKRTFDFVFGTVALIIFLPVMVIIGIIVWVKDPGPIFFTQNRIGLAGQEFKFIKFRTMVVGADKIREEVLGTPDDEMVNRYKDDPRILPFGKVLRRFSLDELPQLWSVVIGDMSIVGPRPLLIEELPLLDPEDHRRHLTKPGLTGLWQVNGRKETTWDQRIQLDLNYVHNWSLGLDFSILFKTAFVVISGHGSY